MKVEEAYKHIEEIIVQGFLAERVPVEGHNFVLKNITDKEYSLMTKIFPEEKTPEMFLTHLCYCIVFIDDINLLVQRKNGFFPTVCFLRQFPEIMIRRLFSLVNTINQQYLDSLDYLEGFCYTPRSRYLWNVLGTTERDYYTGIEGSSLVGMNNVQENWISINKKMDEEERYGRDFNLTLMVTASNNYKSARMISRNYEFHKKELDGLRQDIAKYGYDRKRVQEQTKKAQWTPPIKSREDLVRELYKQMRGEKDQHDIFIEKWIKKQKEKAEEAKKRAEKKQDDFKKKIEDIDTSQVEESRPVSSEELEKILKKTKGTKSNFMSATEEADRPNRFMKKISSRVIRPSRN